MRLGGRKYEAVHGLGVGGGCGSLRSNVEAINDKRVLEKIAAIEGKQARYHVEALMIQAKRVLRAEGAAKPDVGAITAALTELEGTIKAAEEFPGSGAKGKIGSLFMSNAKSFLTTAKQLMRRIRDKVPYSSGDKMMLSNAGSGWMVEGSPPRLLRDHNQLVESYNRGANI
ncbi:MAG: DUF3829 domain-containing protein [Pseudolabrys sp.]